MEQKIKKAKKSSSIAHPDDWHRRCQHCGKLSPTTSHCGRILMPNFQGPCGDSFCYASCTMSSCRPVSGSLCEDCRAELTAAGARIG